MSNSHIADAQPQTEVYWPNVISPYFRTPFTDIFGSLYNHQQYGPCAKFELQMIECMEAYGLDKGRVKCTDLIADFNECHNKTKQYMRFKVLYF